MMTTLCVGVFVLVCSVCILKGEFNHPNHFYEFKPFSSVVVDVKPILDDAMAREYAHLSRLDSDVYTCLCGT